MADFIFERFVVFGLYVVFNYNDVFVYDYWFFVGIVYVCDGGVYDFFRRRRIRKGDEIEVFFFDYVIVVDVVVVIVC